MNIEQILYDIGNLIFSVSVFAGIFFLAGRILSKKICVLPGHSINFIAADPLNSKNQCLRELTQQKNKLSLIKK